MTGGRFTIQDVFPPVSFDQWRAVAEADLQGASFAEKLVTHTYDGIDLQPLYTRQDQPGENNPQGVPGWPPFVRGARAIGSVNGWCLQQEHAHPDPDVTRQAIREDIDGGVTSLLLRLDRAARSALDADDPRTAESAADDGLMLYSASDFESLLADVPLDRIGIALQAGAAFVPAAACLFAFWKRRGMDPATCRGACNADPWATLARDGSLPMVAQNAMRQMAELAKWIDKHYPHVTAVGVDSSPYHDAGATAAQDIGLAVATGIEYLRALTTAGLDIDAAARQICFHFSVGTHHFQSIAKLRAARKLWSRVIEASGGSESAGAMYLHVRTSNRVMTRRDPYINLLRNTVAVFTAGLGGADCITSVPFDTMIGLPDSFSRRIARNTLLILQEESQLHRVIDPAGGSWTLDRLTNDVAEKAWQVVQHVERQGGMLAALQSGWVSAQIDAAFALRTRDIAHRKKGITGVSEFPNLKEECVPTTPPDRDRLRRQAVERLSSAKRDVCFQPASLATSGPVSVAIAAAEHGATIVQIGQLLAVHATTVTVERLELRRLAEPFENLRDASDAWQAAHGKRPQVYLVCMGSVSQYTARATYGKNFFEAGGFEVLSGAEFADAAAAAKAFADSGANIAVICSSDKLYPTMVPELAGQLKAAGAQSVVLAGNPGAQEEAWRAAGVDHFIFSTCNVLATLRELMAQQGVLGR